MRAGRPRGPVLPGVRIWVFTGRTLLKMFIVLILLLIMAGAFRLFWSPVKEVMVDRPGLISGRLIIVDAGHGGTDPGAIGSAGTREKDVTLEIAKKLVAELNRAAVYTGMTRTTDTDLADPGVSRRKVQDLEKRVAFANDRKADLYVSIHANAIASSRWSGAQTFYFPGQPESERLAKHIQTSLVTRLGPNNRLERPGEFRVLRDTHMPAVMVEVGFLSNPREEAMLNDPQYQAELASAIFHGIVSYLEAEDGEITNDTGASSGQTASHEDRQPTSTQPVFGTIALREVSTEGAWLFFQGPSNDLDGLVATKRQVATKETSPEGIVKAVLIALIQGPPRGSDLVPAIPPGTIIKTVSLQNGVASIDLDGRIRAQFWGGGRSELLLVYAIVNTLTSLQEVQSVRLTIDGAHDVSIGGHVDLSRSFSFNAELVTSREGNL